MKIQMLRFGKLGFKEYDSLIRVFEDRLQSHHKISNNVIKLKETYRSDPVWFSKALSKSVFENQKNLVVLYDELGESISSREFSIKFLEWCEKPEIQSILFIVGPPYGFSPEAKKRANVVLSLSSRTLTSDFAWLLAWEQLYRATCINSGIAYHHD